MNRRKQMLQELLAPRSVDGGAAEGSAEAESSAAPGPPPTVPAAGGSGASSRRVPSGAVRAMGLDLARLTDEARRAQELERSTKDGQAVLEVDPATVDPSFAEDRLARTGDADYRRLVRSIAESGQQVPILVRPHPEGAGRYQAAYGHRRVAAAAELGIRVRAVVRALSDAELVVAQGKENAERRDLSFIERALFAADLEARGFGRAVSQAALAAHPADMTRYLAVARGIPRCQIALKVSPAVAPNGSPPVSARRHGQRPARRSWLGLRGRAEPGSRTRRWAGGSQALFLKRQLSLPVSTMSQWWVSRSSMAVVILASPTMS